MSKFYFHSFCDYRDDEKLAELNTTDGLEIPMLICIDNYAEVADMKEGYCYIDVMGIGKNVEVYPTIEAFKCSHEGVHYISMIPIGSFSLKEDDEDFEKSPRILFSGILRAFERNVSAEEDEPNVCLTVETLEFTVNFLTHYDGDLDVGYIVCGSAFLYGDLIPDEEE